MQAVCSPIVLMLIDAAQTLGEAFLAGLYPHARCLRGKRMGPVKVQPCGYDTPLSLETLIWTRGAAFPCWKVRHRLKCPRCGGIAIEVAWMPGASPGARAGRDLYQCEVMRARRRQQ